MARRALILANGSFADATISALASPVSDAKRFCDLLKREDVGGFDVTLCTNVDSVTARRQVQKFFDAAAFGDMNLILVSGHGIKDRAGKLHFATTDTDMGALSATSLESRFLMEHMDNSAASKHILFIDTCYSGAFGKGMVNTKSAALTVTRDDFGNDEATGKAIITASTAIQLAGEAEANGATQSVFTRHLIDGIESGEADVGQDGQISLSDLFEYVRKGLKRDAPDQTPQPYYYGLDGSTVVTLNPAPKPVELPQELRAQIASKKPLVRGGAVDALVALARQGGREKDKAIEALRALEEDDSSVVQSAANRGLVKLLGPPPSTPQTFAAIPQSLLDEPEPKKHFATLRALPTWNKIALSVLAMLLGLIALGLIVDPPVDPVPTSNGTVAETAPDVPSVNLAASSTPMQSAATENASADVGDTADNLFAKGKAAYDQKQYGPARDDLRAARSKGSADASTLLGTYWVNQFGGKQSIVQAVNLYDEGCRGGSALGCKKLGAVAAQVQSDPETAQRARDLLEQACNKGVRAACGVEFRLKTDSERQPVTQAPSQADLQAACNFGDQAACAEK